MADLSVRPDDIGVPFLVLRLVPLGSMMRGGEIRLEVLYEPAESVALGCSIRSLSMRGIDVGVKSRYETQLRGELGELAVAFSVESGYAGRGKGEGRFEVFDGRLVGGDRLVSALDVGEGLGKAIGEVLMQDSLFRQLGLGFEEVLSEHLGRLGARIRHSCLRHIWLVLLPAIYPSSQLHRLLTPARRQLESGPSLKSEGLDSAFGLGQLSRLVLPILLEAFDDAVFRCDLLLQGREPPFRRLRRPFRFLPTFSLDLYLSLQPRKIVGLACRPSAASKKKLLLPLSSL